MKLRIQISDLSEKTSYSTNENEAVPSYSSLLIILSLFIACSCKKMAAVRLIQIKTASWEVDEAARVEDLQRWVKEALENASVAATKKVQFCPITAIYSK